ncbi:MAG: right-handed parallel beta-helix repeat-containing protein [Promethearchaeota archaeon]
MRDKLFRKGLVYGILMILILLNFMSTTGSDSISLKRKIDMPNAEDNKYNDFPYFNYYKNSHDVTEKQLQYNLPGVRSYSLYHRGIFRDQLKKGMSLDMQDDLTWRKSNDRELTLEGLRSNGDYTPHDPIRIYSDDDFTVENGVTGGSGTKNDPYTIEGWEIDTNLYTAIDIKHTTAYFVVRNCLLKNATFGIYLKELSVGSITDCHILFNIWGIGIFDSSNIVLRNNTLYDNDYTIFIDGLEMGHYYHDIDTSNTVNGKPVYYLVNESSLVFDNTFDIGFLGLVGCEYIQVTDVTISDSCDAVLLAGTCNSTISSSTFVQCHIGIRLFESSNNTIIECDLFNASIGLQDSPNNTMRNNSISGDWVFYVMGYTLDAYYQDIDTSNIVNGKPMYYLVEEEDKVFKESEVGFLALVNCKNMVVKNVEISYNGFGLLFAETKASVENCMTLYNNVGLFVFGDCELKIIDHKSFDLIGCWLVYASNVEFISCDIGGWWGGIQIDYSHDITIQECTFKECYDDGVTLINSWNNVICKNVFPLESDAYGICLEENSWGNSIHNNDIHQGYGGIDIGSNCHNNTIRNNKVHNLDCFGIFLFKSNDNYVHHNSIHNNNIGYYDIGGGVMVYKSERCKINRNNIYDNNNWGLEANRCNVDATYNWWGSKDGPSGIGPGDGDWIEVYEATVLYEPWLKSPVSRNREIIYWYSGLLLRLIEQFPILRHLLRL